MPKHASGERPPNTLVREKLIVAGCGEMGWPMLRNLHAANYDARGYDIRPPETYGEHCGLMLKSAADIADASILMVVVRDATQIEELCFSSQAVFTADRYPRTVILSSTVAPDFVGELKAKLPPSVHLVDAPMSGAPIAASDGTLSYMLGGEQRDIDYLMPLFQTLGRSIEYAGPLGCGMQAKVMNNYVAACSVVAVRRAIARANTFGFNTDKLLKIIAASSGQNWYASNLQRINWSRQNYDPANTIGIIEKDVKCALQSCTDSDGFDAALLKALRDLPNYPE